MVIPSTSSTVGGWTLGPVIGRRPAGVARDAVHPGTGARAVLVTVDDRFTGRGLPDPETVARAAIVGSPAVMPMLDAGLLEDGTRWYVTPATPGPVLDPSAGCSPRRAAMIVESVARALAAVHAVGLVHGLIGPSAIIPAQGRHAERPVSRTLLLDTGVAALVGDRAADLAAASGVSSPADRGPAADVHALGALLLRLLTAAAPAGPALAALPVALRALLSSMLDEDPTRRPTADAVASALAGLREGLLATGPVEVPVAAASAAPVPAPRPTPAPAPVPSTPVLSAPVLAPLRPLPAPLPAPVTLESPILAPSSAPVAAPSLWTGPVPVAIPAHGRRRRVQRFLLLAGGVGVAGMLVGVLTHLPIGQQGDERALAAVGEHGAFAVPAARSTTAAATTSSAARATTRPTTGRSSTPAFVRPVAAVPSPLTASATSATPSRTTAPSPHRKAHATTAPSSPTTSTRSSAPVTGSASAPPPSASTSTAPSPSTPPDSTPPDSTAPSTSTPPDTSAATTPPPSPTASDSATEETTTTPATPSTTE